MANRRLNLIPFKTGDPKTKLSTIVLLIIAGFVFCIICLILFQSLESSADIRLLNQNSNQQAAQNNFGDSTFAHTLEMIKHVQEENKEYRDFILKLTQMVLLNLLLPVLTAVLGYKFGSKNGEE
jgi:uncharacterized membrane protein